MNEQVSLGPYIATRKLTIPQGKIGQAENGKSSMRVFKNEVFSFDGDEPIDIDMLLKTLAIQPYTLPLDELEGKK